MPCLYAYGVHTQDDNKEASAIFLGFPKADLFEPLKGADVNGESVYSDLQGGSSRNMGM